MIAGYFSEDIQYLLALFDKHDVHYVIVGGEAVIYHGHARLTGDVDIFYDISRSNVDRLYAALVEFWDGKIPGIETADEFLTDGFIVQFGVPPNRVDLMNHVDGVSFKEAWAGRVDEHAETCKGKICIHYIGLDELTRNKRAAGRAKDIDDLKYLEAAKKPT